MTAGVWGTFLCGAVAGAALMYFLDPDRGGRRRALLRDKAVGLSNDVGEAATGAARDLRNRAQGVVVVTGGTTGIGRATAGPAHFARIGVYSAEGGCPMQPAADDTGMGESEVDPRVTYPCYKSLDEFIDVGRLKSLDGFVTERIGRRLRARADDLFMNSFRLKASTPEAPGQRMIHLTQSVRAFNYYDLDRPELWRPTEAAREFAPLMDFIAALPFEATGRMLIMYDTEPRPVPAHRDHLSTEVCHEFIWFRTNMRKPFYVLDHRSGEMLYVESYAAWFDTVNQFHGSDPGEGLTFSVRVDGRFTEEFRRMIPEPAFNPASAPALWACSAGR